MKILKKIGIGFLVIVICFCSCFKFVNAFQNDFVFRHGKPYIESYIGSINFAIGLFGDHAPSMYNDSFDLQTGFYLPDSLENSFLITSTRDYGVDTRFTINDSTQNYSVSQDVYFTEYGLFNFDLNFNDIFVYNNADFDLPNLIIDNGYNNYEQSYSFTYEANVFDITTLTLREIKEDQPIQLLTEDGRHFTYPLRDLFKDIVRSEMVNTDGPLGGLGYIKDFTITIQMLQPVSSNYPTTITLDSLLLDTDVRYYAINEFYNSIYGFSHESSGLFGWLLDSVDSFMSAEIFPNFSIGVLLGTIVAVPLLIYILRLFMGG